MLELQIMKYKKKCHLKLLHWQNADAKRGRGIPFNSLPSLCQCDDLMLIHCAVYFILSLHFLICVRFHPSLIEIFSLIFL